MSAFSTGFFGSVTSMIIDPLFSHALPFSGFGRNEGQLGTGTGTPLCMPTKAMYLPSGYCMTFGW